MRRNRKLFKVNADKLAILEEQDNRCAYCAHELNALNPAYFDHFVPRVAGGSNKRENIFACCFDCNMAKMDKVFGSFEECRQYIYEWRKRHKKLSVYPVDME